jgi:hypothetical protein
MNVQISELKIARLSDKPIKEELLKADYPIPPLVFGEGIENKTKCFRVRMVVYLPSKVKTCPVLKVENEGNPVAFDISKNEQLLGRSFILTFDYVYKKTPKKYRAWSVYFEYTVENDSSVDYLLTHLQDIDPKTSRGTVTTVQSALV